MDVFQTGSGTSTNMNANEVIATLASRALGAAVHPNDHVNRGQSSNDTIPTALHVFAALALRDALLPALGALREAILARARELDGVVKTGRTHLVDALPIRLGQELGAWAQHLALASERLEAALPRLLELAQGGTGVGTGANTHREFAARFAAKLAERTGLAFRPSRNAFASLAVPDAALELHGALRGLAAALLKITSDLRLMASGPRAGLAELALPALQPGSSIMPGKVNPVVPEAVAMACLQVLGHDVALALGAGTGTFQLNTAWPLFAWNLDQSLALLANGARAAGRACGARLHGGRGEARRAGAAQPDPRDRARAVDRLRARRGDREARLRRESPRARGSRRDVRPRCGDSRSSTRPAAAHRSARLTHVAGSRRCTCASRAASARRRSSGETLGWPAGRARRSSASGTRRRVGCGRLRAHT